MPSNIIFELPLQNQCFTGRDDEIKAITNSFKDLNCHTLVICGIEGMGKTDLVSAYCYLQELPHLIWIKKPEEDYIVLAATMGLLEYRNLPDDNTAAINNARDAVKTWLKNNTGWLLVFDNIPSLEKLTPYLPDHNDNGFVLITSRSKYWGTIPKLEIGPMSEIDSVNLFKKILTNEENDETLIELANKLACIPQELIKAAIYIEQACIPAAEYLTTIPQINLAKLTQYAFLKNYIDFLDPPMPQNQHFAFKKSPKQLVYSLHQYLNNKDLTSLSGTNQFFDRLFSREINNRALTFFNDGRTCVDKFFLSFDDASKLEIKKKFEDWCKANQAYFDLVTFEGNAFITEMNILNGFLSLEEKPDSKRVKTQIPIDLARNVTEKMTVQIHHDFLPPALRKTFSRLNVMSAFQKSFYKSYISSDLMIDFNNCRRQTINLAVDLIGERSEIPESGGNLNNRISALLLQYELSLGGQISQNGKTILLSELFPEFVNEEQLVVFKVCAPIAYFQIDYCPNFNLEHKHSEVSPSDPAVCSLC